MQLNISEKHFRKNEHYSLFTISTEIWNVNIKCISSANIRLHLITIARFFVTYVNSETHLWHLSTKCNCQLHDGNYIENNLSAEALTAKLVTKRLTIAPVVETRSQLLRFTMRVVWHNFYSQWRRYLTISACLKILAWTLCEQWPLFDNVSISDR